MRIIDALFLLTFFTVLAGVGLAFFGKRVTNVESALLILAVIANIYIYKKAKDGDFAISGCSIPLLIFLVAYGFTVWILIRDSSSWNTSASTPISMRSNVPTQMPISTKSTFPTQAPVVQSIIRSNEPRKKNQPINPTYTPHPCYHWDEINSSMEGDEICVYGTVYSLYNTNENSTRIKFSSTPNTFFISSNNYIFTDLGIGDCVQADSTLLVYGNIPYMEVNRTLFICDDWMK